MVASLLILPMPASGLTRSLGQFLTQVGYALTDVGDAILWLSRLPLIAETAFVRKQEPLAISDRIAAVSRIVISPSKYVTYEDAPMIFCAAGYDRPLAGSGQTVQGVPYDWSVSDPSKAAIDRVSGRLTPLKPGLVWITCQAGSVHAMAPVLIKPGHKPLQTEADWRADQASLNDDGSVGGGRGGIAGLLDRLTTTAQAQSGGGDIGFDQLWSTPGNLTGTPRSVMMHQTALGPCLPESSNFELPIPIANLGGRGISTKLMLYLNSQPWAAQGGNVYFNPVQGWPSPGFSLGMGRIVVYGSSLMLVDPDGTRHQLALVSSGVYSTTDGTHITGNFNPALGGYLYYPDGTSVYMINAGGSLQPFQITDTNGNFVTLGHAGTAALSYINDTKGRVISFVYNSAGYLTSITGPGPGGVTIPLMDFDYTDVALNLNFTSGWTPQNATQGQLVHALKHVYNPWTNTGYLFTYSGYGVITTVSKRRQMSGGPDNITDGVESANATFAYPAGGAAVAGLPGFGTWTESPGSSNPFVYSAYVNLLGSNTVTYRIIPPDYQSNLSSYPISWYTVSTDSSSPANGLLTRVDIQDAYGNQYRKILYNYALDPGGSPQVQSITTYDETNTPTMVNFDYDQYGNVTNQREFGYQVSGAFQVRRRTHTTYLTDPNYITRYMLNRPTEVDVYDALLNTNDADDLLIAKKTFTYDQYGSGMTDYGITQQTNIPGHGSSDDKNFTLRGNVTGTTTWTDLTANTSITRITSYDIFGAAVNQQLSCCQQKSYTMGSTDYYTNPTQVTSGAGPTVNDTYGWDFNIDAVTSSSSPGNVTKGAQYDNAFRPTSITVNPSGSKTFTYNDAAMSVSMTVNTGSGSGHWSQAFDGWGRTTQSVDQGGGQVFATYDAFGRLATKTNPLAPGITSGPTTAYQCDPLGRVVLTTLPDGNTIRTTYSGSTITATDQVGRKTQQQTDGLGRLIAVTEQDPGSGSLTQTTNYSYDLLNNIVQVNQGGQIRSWKYDASGRLLYENIPEQSATINDGTGTMWTCKWTYNDFGLVVSKTDARGVVASYGYTGLNKLSSISYNTSNAPGVAATAAVGIGYDSAGRINSASVGAYYAESYTYDPSYPNPGYGSPGLTSLTRTIDNQNYTSSYINDSFRTHIAITYPSGRLIGYNRESNTLRLGSITEQNGPTYLNNISYNPAGQITQFSLGNGVTQAAGYDSNRLSMTTESATTAGGASGNLMNLSYSYQASAGQLGAGTTAGNAGPLMSISGTINSQPESATYTYDLNARLVTSSQTSNGASAQRRFAYDRWGNRTGEWDSTSGGNQLQNITLQQAGGAPTNALATISSAGESVYNTPGQCGSPTTVNVGRTGRYVRVQLMTAQYLHLAEVQVIGTSGQNLALGKTASQSSTAFGGTASRANDGNTDGNYADGSVSHTDFQWLPWWQVDLGSSQQITSVNVWNRTDCCQSRTSNFNVIVSDQPIATTTYIYDAAGNVLYDGLHSYQYDAENRLVSVDGGATAQYYYDFQNRRVKKILGSVTTHYVWEGGQVLAEHNGSTGSVLVDYIYVGATLIAKVAGGVTNYLVSDRLSVRMALDTSGNVIGRQAHLPFGEDFAESGQQEKHHFTSYEEDAETGADYAVNRFCAAAVGRFMSADAYKQSGYLVDPQSWNRYSYTGNDPINRADESGLSWTSLPIPWPSGPHESMDVHANTTNDVAGTGGGLAGGHGSLNDGSDGSGLVRGGQTFLIDYKALFHRFLLSMSDACKTALASSMADLNAADVKLYDVSKMGSDKVSADLGASHINDGDPNENMNTWFLTIWGGNIWNTAESVYDATSPQKGIYYDGDGTTFSGGNMYLLLHEMVHMVRKETDEQLAGDFGLMRGIGETWSTAVSRFFNSGCTQKTP